eukprot:1029629-Rhodomonas_salina.2
MMSPPRHLSATSSAPTTLPPLNFATPSFDLTPCTVSSSEQVQVASLTVLQWKLQVGGMPVGPSASEAASESAKQRLPPLRRQALSSEQAAPRNQIETTFLAQHVLRLLELLPSPAAWRPTIKMIVSVHMPRRPSSFKHTTQRCCPEGPGQSKTRPAGRTTRPAGQKVSARNRLAEPRDSDGGEEGLRDRDSGLVGKRETLGVET